MKFGAVAIGRNEGERLRRCLKSLSAATALVYVDSGSTDGSAQWAHAHGVEVIELDMSLPFTAARARNAGFKRLRFLVPDLAYVQFVDGDCELVEGWPEQSLSFLRTHLDVAAVCGRRRESCLCGLLLESGAIKLPFHPWDHRYRSAVLASEPLRS